MKRRPYSSPQRTNIPITREDIIRIRHEAPKTLEYYRNFGLAEARSRSMNIFLSGAIPLLGMLVFDWSIFAMLLFMVADAAITTLVDVIQYPLARQWLAASHKKDHESGQILLICDGLEDGTNERADTGKPVSPAVILFFGCVSTLLLVPIIIAAVDHIGMMPLREIIKEKAFLWAVGIDAVWRVTTGLVSAVLVRFSQPGEKMIFMESGSVAVLYAGLLILIWLPLKWGSAGLTAMFIIMYAIRLAFGIFAYWWTPRTVSILERRHQQNDFSLKKAAPKS